MQRICIDNVFPVLITNRSHLREQFTQLLPVVITGTRKTQVILQIRPDLYLDEFVFVFSSWLLHYFYPQNNKNDPRSPQTCMHTSEQTERHANTESSTVWEMPFYNTKQVSSTTKQSALNQQRTLRCGKGPAAALREGALATQAIPSKEPGGASRSRGGSAQEALTHCSRTPASRRCSSTRSPACNLAVQWHGSLSPQRPQRLWAPCLSGLAGPREPPTQQHSPQHPWELLHLTRPRWCAFGILCAAFWAVLGQLFPCAMRQSRASLTAGWQAAPLGWREHYYLAVPRLPACTCGYVHMTA